MYDTISQALEGGMDRRGAVQMLEEVINEARQYALYEQSVDEQSWTLLTLFCILTMRMCHISLSFPLQVQHR